MKTLLALVAAIVAAGCGGGPCSSAYAGTWIGTTTTDQVVVDASCGYHYAGADGCQSAGTYGAPLGSAGSVAVNITSETPANDQGCLPIGSYSCGYSASSSTLTINCGAGAFSYGR